MLSDIETNACLEKQLHPEASADPPNCSNCTLIKIVQLLEEKNIAVIVQCSTRGQGLCSGISWGRILSIALFMKKYFSPFVRGLFPL